MKQTIHIILYTPEIPNNTGAIIRLCANTGAKLHLVKPLGFELEEKRLRRAGLDYHEFAEMKVWETLDDALTNLAEQGITHVFPMTAKASTNFFDQNLTQPLALLFGPESVGLPEHVRKRFPESTWSALPMLPTSRSLNIANAVSIAVYEAWRQRGFKL